MIHILFLPGSYGSTVHYILKKFNKNFKNRQDIDTDLVLLDDGSSHGYKKSGHFLTRDELRHFLHADEFSDDTITTPIYPMPDMTIEEIFSAFKEKRPNDHYILLYVDDIKHAEINILARYHKIATGSGDLGIGSFCEENQHNIIQWNKKYSHWSELEQWELREWFSLFYVSWSADQSEAINLAGENWYCISTTQLLNAPISAFKEIINYCGLFDETLENDFVNFVSEWRAKQQYLIDEYNTICTIVNMTVSGMMYSWSKLNIIAEAIIQQKLRAAGYDLKCYKLNDFPTTSDELNNLLIKL